MTDMLRALPGGRIAFQLWSSRSGPDLGTQFRRLKALGYTDVQPYHTQWDAPEEMKALLEETGLGCTTGHFTLEMFEQEFARVTASARILGLELAVAPFLPPERRPADADGWRALGRKLELLAARLADHGLDFAWHNHAFEFEPLPDGSLPIEHLLGDRLLFEIDVAWIARAGADPLPWLRRYAGRIPAVHVKDMAPPGMAADEGGWADLGQGVLDWDRLLPASIATGAGLLVLEHDLPSDWDRFARRSMDGLQSAVARAEAVRPLP
ncbi:sugar phosphate isomerase/epimerase [Poseidonocella sp. HB161398]|uniref:sugar phosphate isomerase/epimerase family protein n=1 Tax=Poseidonocella sp. HB161398 TaxID=2320855 RepID=UPI001F0EC84E|nr:sugar phosphate isomerase/epimerase [Poseidonocella sp. HB161398]